jgi:hypothetical protein
MTQSRLLVLLWFLAAPVLLLAQGVPQGPEFRVNNYTAGKQAGSSVASDSAGNFVVAWRSLDQDGSGYGVFAQRYSSTGLALGGEFQVNGATLSDQLGPSLAFDSAGNFVVAWMSQDGSGYGIFGQRYRSSGAPLGGEFRVNTFTALRQGLPSVACDPAGNFVIAWESYGQDGSSYGVFAQRYASTGAPLGAEFRVNSFTADIQRVPSTAADAAGNFVVAWQSLDEDGNGYGVFAQRYANTGSPVAGEFRVNTFTPGSQSFPSVTSDPAGQFVVAWMSSSGQDGSLLGVFAQRYASTGLPLGGEFRANSYTTGSQDRPAVASDADGNFVIAWTSQDQDGSGFGVFAQRYGSTGAPLGGEFRVNTFTTSYQRIPSVASDPAGNFVIAWHSFTQDGSNEGVFAQRYNMIVPVELQDFRVE